MDILIVDDEELAVERLVGLIEEIGHHQVVGTAANGIEAVDQAQKHEPDLLLLDVQMPEMDGLEAAQHMRKLDSPPIVIFCTAYDEYALEAFDTRAVDYLVKPVRRERLEQALKRASQFHAGAQRPPETDQRSHLCARMRGNLELIPVESVICLIAEHKYVTVVHDNGEALIEEPLVALEDEFDDRFLRIHRNALVARNRITGLEKAPDGGTVIVLGETDRKLEISRRNLPSVRKVVTSL